MHNQISVKRILFFLFALILIQSCANREEKKSDSYSGEGIDSVLVQQPAPVEISERADTVSITKHVQPTVDKNVKMNTSFVTFANSDGNGFGYDIHVDGRVYIHQPYIPAVSGNNGFASKEDAEKVARLMEYKIKNNILPPTIEIHELDSLGIKK